MEQALWLVLGIALLRGRSTLGAAEALDLALPGASGDATASRAISSSALSQARQLLGAEPLQWLFQHTAAQWAHKEAGRHRWHGLYVYALDGVVWRTPDTQDNRESFGGQRNHAEHQSPFPQVRMACLLDARARLLVDASLDSNEPSEYTLAQQPWPHAHTVDGTQLTLFTSLDDPKRWPADAVFALHHERWEIELAYGEIKTEMLGQRMTLRSQQSE